MDFIEFQSEMVNETNPEHPKEASASKKKVDAGRNIQNTPGRNGTSTYLLALNLGHLVPVLTPKKNQAMKRII